MTIKAAVAMSLNEFIEFAFLEDVGSGDHTSLACISADAKAKATIKVKEHGIIAGVAVAERIFNYADPNLSFNACVEDGHTVYKGDVIAIIQGPTRSLLTAERLVLNCMQRMSGIA